MHHRGATGGSSPRGRFDATATCQPLECVHSMRELLGTKIQRASRPARDGSFLCRAGIARHHKGYGASLQGVRNDNAGSMRGEDARRLTMRIAASPRQATLPPSRRAFYRPENTGRNRAHPAGSPRQSQRPHACLIWSLHKKELVGRNDKDPMLAALLEAPSRAGIASFPANTHARVMGCYNLPSKT